MLTYLLYIYLTGAVGITSYGSYKCATDEKPQPVDCYTGSAVVGAIWPLPAGLIIYEKTTGKSAVRL